MIYIYIDWRPSVPESCGSESCHPSLQQGVCAWWCIALRLHNLLSSQGAQHRFVPISLYHIFERFFFPTGTHHLCGEGWEANPKLTPMNSMQLETSSRFALYLHVSTPEWLGAVWPCGVCRPNGMVGRIWTFPKTVDTWAHHPVNNPLQVELQGVSAKGTSPCSSPAGWPAMANQETIRRCCVPTKHQNIFVWACPTK